MHVTHVIKITNASDVYIFHISTFSFFAADDVSSMEQNTTEIIAQPAGKVLELKCPSNETERNATTISWFKNGHIFVERLSAGKVH